MIRFLAALILAIANAGPPAQADPWHSQTFEIGGSSPMRVHVLLNVEHRYSVRVVAGPTVVCVARDPTVDPDAPNRIDFFYLRTGDEWAFGTQRADVLTCSMLNPALAAGQPTVVEISRIFNEGETP